MARSLSMADLFEKLSTLGLSASYVRRAGLPSWWDDELNDSPAAVLEGAMHISRRLHINLTSLLRDDLEAAFKKLPQTKFKYHLQNSLDVPSIPHQIASRVAELIAFAVVSEPFSPVSESVFQVRAEMLETHSKITLEGLLDYCWRHGILVAYFNDYPEGTRKITGMIQWQEGHPVILLSHKRTQPAWLAFHLAHELAHLALGHVKEGILVDDKIDRKSDDAEETAANQFAVSLLTNQFDDCFRSCNFYNGNQLKKKILEKLEIDSTVDACALAFNYSWHTGNFGLANKVVKDLNCTEDGDRIVNQFLKDRLDWDLLSDDNAHHLYEILGDEIGDEH